MLNNLLSAFNADIPNEVKPASKELTGINRSISKDKFTSKDYLYGSEANRLDLQLT